MLITFESKVGRITMFGDIALQLLKLAGHSGTVPGALLARDIPEALQNLERGLAALETAQGGAEPKEDEEEDAPRKPSLHTRAFPLIGLLKDALKHDCDVLWEQEGQAPLKF